MRAVELELTPSLRRVFERWKFHHVCGFNIKYHAESDLVHDVVLEEPLHMQREVRSDSLGNWHIPSARARAGDNSSADAILAAASEHATSNMACIDRASGVTSLECESPPNTLSKSNTLDSHARQNGDSSREWLCVRRREPLGRRKRYRRATNRLPS